MSHNKHIKARGWQRRTLGLEPRRSKFRRKILGIPVVGWLVGIPAVALAVVGYTILFGASGTISSSDGLDLTLGNVAGTIDEGVAVCTATNSGGTIDLAIQDFDPSDICRINVSVTNNSATPAVIQDFRLDSADFAGGAVTSSLGACGGEVEPGGTIFGVYLHAGASLQPGQSFALDPLIDGLYFVSPDDFDAGECPIP